MVPKFGKRQYLSDRNIPIINPKALVEAVLTVDNESTHFLVTPNKGRKHIIMVSVLRKVLFLSGLLCTVSPVLTPADYSVVSYGSAVCDGTTNDTTAFANTYAQVQATGGGRVLVPSGKTCRVEGYFIDQTTSGTSATPVALEAEGGIATLTCQTCATLIYIGSTSGSEWFSIHKSIKNIALDLSNTSNNAPIGIYARNVVDMRLDHVMVLNSAPTKAAKGIHIYGDGLHNCSLSDAACHSSGNLLLQPYLNGYFSVGIQIDGANSSVNDNANQTVIIDGQVLRPYGASCSKVTTNTYGIIHRYGDALTLVNSNFEGFDHGMEFGGLNAKVIGGRTECNNTGAYINDTTYPNHYHTSFIGSQHSDGINTNGSNRVSIVESYFGGNLKTNLESVRQIRGVSNLCTTTTDLNDTCYGTVAISPALSSSNYSVQCTLTTTGGIGRIHGISKTSPAEFKVTLINQFYGVPTSGTVDCMVYGDDTIGATSTR